MGWVQLGLFLAPPQLSPKAKRAKTVSASKPIPKAKKPANSVKLAPGELDDPIDF